MWIKKFESFRNSKIDNCIKDVLSFMKDNGIKTWDDYLKSSPFQRDTINKLISYNIESKEDLDRFRFGIKLEISSNEELRELLKEYEKLEEYEKCSLIQKKIGSI